MRKRLILCSAVVAGLFLAVYCSRDFWIGQVRVYVLGWTEVRADQFGYLLPNVDEIDVFAIEGQDFPAPGGAGRVAGYVVTDRTVLHGDEAEKAANLWRRLPRGRGFSAMCHEPIYALRFRQHGKLLFETTVCWHCHNYTIPMGIFGRTEYGFDSQGEAAQALLALLQSHVPVPTKPHA